MGAGMLGVGIYNIVSLLGFDVFARSVYITGGVLFVMVGAAKMIISLLGMIGFFLENRIILTVVSIFHTLLLIIPCFILANKGSLILIIPCFILANKGSLILIIPCFILANKGSFIYMYSVASI